MPAAGTPLAAARSDRPREEGGAQKQLRSLRGIYIDCGTREPYHLHYGARILHARLRGAKIPQRYEECDDDHSSDGYRLDGSLPWLYAKIVPRGKSN